MGRDSYRARLAATVILLWAVTCLNPEGELHAQGYSDELHGDCLLCHETGGQSDGSLLLPEPQVCQLCHSPHNDHAISIQPTATDVSLPLNNGLITCITCHDPHSPQPLQLRLPGTQLCVACHDF